ncbi:hypothetical protein [Amycolatopsis sp. cmx-4-83]|uniref:hypothetical protein n=1 Tax=Amycolatopsis sp. cmx-4-83 TaxID=2790940 RepID=UPI00397B9476
MIGGLAPALPAGSSRPRAGLKSPLTDELLDEAVTAHVAETDDPNGKKSLPPAKKLATSDVPKDSAAMANRGGGMIVYGVAEEPCGI